MVRFLNICFFIFLFHPKAEGTTLRVEKKGDLLEIKGHLDKDYDIRYIFKRCMFNQLYTFYEVSFVPKVLESNYAAGFNNPPEHVLNRATSDNIGPFMLKDLGWTGGNHSFQDSIPTAAHNYYQVFLDEKLLLADTIAYGSQVQIKVNQVLFNPSKLSKRLSLSYQELLFCEENVTYLVSGNSIQVSVSHDYKNQEEVQVERYYGAQSMFINEKQILCPSGAYANWTKIEGVSRFNKKEFPRFNRFIERNDSLFQAIHLLEEGLGNHKELDDDAAIFIGNSYTKSYHNLISKRSKNYVDQDNWSATYTWFREAWVDREDVFSYFGSLNGKPIWYIDCLKAAVYEIPIPTYLQQEKFDFSQKDSSLLVKRKKGDVIKIKAKSRGSVLLSW